MSGNTSRDAILDKWLLAASGLVAGDIGDKFLAREGFEIAEVPAGMFHQGIDIHHGFTAAPEQPLNSEQPAELDFHQGAVRHAQEIVLDAESRQGRCLRISNSRRQRSCPALSTQATSGPPRRTT